MKEILRDIVAAIIGGDKEIKITEKEEDGMVILELSVSKENTGKIIGRKGKIAKALRTVVKAYANRINKKVSIEII